MRGLEQSSRLPDRSFLQSVYIALVQDDTNSHSASVSVGGLAISAAVAVLAFAIKEQRLSVLTWSVLPAVPTTILAQLILLGARQSARWHYLRRLEHVLHEDSDDALTRLDPANAFDFRYFHLMSSIDSYSLGLPQFKVLSWLVASAGASLELIFIAVSVYHMPGVWPKATVAFFYSVVLVVMAVPIRSLMLRSSAFGDKVQQHHMAHYYAGSSNPRTGRSVQGNERGAPSPTTPAPDG